MVLGDEENSGKISMLEIFNLDREQEEQVSAAAALPLSQRRLATGSAL